MSSSSDLVKLPCVTSNESPTPTPDPKLPLNADKSQRLKAATRSWQAHLCYLIYFTYLPTSSSLLLSDKSKAANAVKSLH